MKSVELHQAFSWICDSCGHRNFERAIAVEMSEEDREELCYEAGVDPDEGEWLRAPELVICSKCKEEYKVEEPFFEDDEEKSSF